MSAAPNPQRKNGEVRASALGLPLSQLRFVSLNAWGGREWPALAPWLVDVRADILCLQEMIRAPLPSPEWLEYKDPNRRLAQRANLFADVCAMLPSHQAHFAAAARGPLYDRSGAAHASEHGLAAWVRMDLAITEVFQGFAFGSYRCFGWGDEPVPRAIQIHRIASPDTGRTLVFAHFHGIREASGKSDTPARAAQTQAVADALEAQLRPGEPAILAGDFNLLPESAFFATMSDLGLTDLVTTRGHTDTRTSLYAKPQRFADYLLVNREVSVEAFDVPGEPEVSDHRPLILDLVL
ncbi:MAG: endonuclease/exonuclease/phosphatase family protein [Pseudomonadota bacterium]